MLAKIHPPGCLHAAARWFPLVFVLVMFVGAARPASAGGLKNDSGGWIMLFGSGAVDPTSSRLGRLRWWFDLQPRFTEDSDFNQLLVRPGLGYTFGNASLWLGYAYILTDPAARASFEEHRIWQQLLYSRRVRSLGLQSRTRLEQRFVEGGSDTGWRFREFVKVAHPLGFGGLGLAAYDEVFFDLNDTDWGADPGLAQNRLFAGLSWKPSASSRLTIELGYLNQFIRNENRRDPMNHIASLNFLYSAP